MIAVMTVSIRIAAAATSRGRNVGRAETDLRTIQDRSNSVNLIGADLAAQKVVDSRRKTRCGA